MKKIRKLLITISILYMTVIPLSAISLTSGGYIDTGDTCQHIGFIDRYTCLNNSIDIEHHDHQSVTLRLFNSNETILGEWQFRQTIDPILSPNLRWLVFSTGDAVRTLDTDTGEMHIFPAADAFTIDQKGNLALWDSNSNTISYREKVYSVDGIVRKMIVNNDTILIQTQTRFYNLEDNQTLFSTNGSLHDVALQDGKIYVSERIGQEFKLINVTDGTIEKTRLAPASRHNRTHQPIPSPLHYGEADYPHPIGNTYLEIQDYGGTPYLHPGVDFLGQPNEQVFAVADGIVKAVLTTGGDLYWRVAIALENTNDECEGYLYAHLNQNSITVAEGDAVQAGDVIGTLVEWPVSDFHHCHYARIQDSGVVWDGQWWTTDDPLRDTYEHFDTNPPVFENALQNELFAFRISNNNYANPEALSGTVDIIAKAHDIINSNWRCTISRIGYRIAAVENPDSILIDQLAFTMDYPNDTYGEATYDAECLATIFSRDNTCFSIGDYTSRNYYYIISHADADTAMTENDALQRFDTTQLPDGFYTLEVWAEDGVGNTTTESMVITINNNPDDPPTFTGMPFVVTVPADSIVTLSLWEHVQDDFTPDEELVFAFQTNSLELEWSFDDSTGVLSVWHDVQEAQNAPMSITATDSAQQSANCTVYFHLEPLLAINDITEPYRTSLDCFPNPFNPTTTIEFSLASDGKASIEVFNVRGQKVKTLLDSTMPSGKHQIVWDATDAASGIYFIRLRTDGETRINKALLLK